MAAATAGPSPFGAAPSFNFDALKDFSDLTPSIQSHLAKVYLTLAASLLVAALGAYVHVAFGWGGALSSIAAIVGILWLNATPPIPANESFRTRLLAAVAFAQGLSVGPLVAAVADVQPGLVAVALGLTALAFACFSAAALTARRREYLYLGAFIATSASVMVGMRVAAWVFGPSVLLLYSELYGGLIVFCCYIVYDTQVIVERAAKGVRDHVTDALELLLDFVGVFVRLLAILMRNRQEEEAEQQRSNRRKTGAGTSRR
eukprot:TRINITY_DN80498_c0_g1_i1.p1 TRINITY_DN80498_c0_g1~~TRINITY_DN80498_c0_g1_i1.p1  ORF type:complete len:260 (-),score=-6.74 TRINITY_DN80498_c0_g1_i1:396-1175(-)